MAKKVNTAVIGLFVVGAALLLVAAAFFVSGTAFGEKREKAIVVFDGSVKGLKVGAPVAFKGVQIGQVTDIDIMLNTDTLEVLMPVEIELITGRIKRIGMNVEVDKTEELVEHGMRGQLQLQSLLTGLLYIQFDFYPNSELRYSGIESEYPELPTIPTDMERISRSLDQLDFSGMISGLDNIIQGLDRTINDEETQRLAGNLNETLNALENLSTRLQDTVDALQPGLQSLVANTDATMQELERDIPALTESAEQTLNELDATLEAARMTLEGVDYTLSDDSAVLYDFREAAQELARAGRSLQRLAEALEQRPESILRGRRQVGD